MRAGRGDQALRVATVTLYPVTQFFQADEGYWLCNRIASDVHRE